MNLSAHSDASKNVCFQNQNSKYFAIIRTIFDVDIFRWFLFLTLMIGIKLERVKFANLVGFTNVDKCFQEPYGFEFQFSPAFNSFGNLLLLDIRLNAVCICLN